PGQLQLHVVLPRLPGRRVRRAAAPAVEAGRQDSAAAALRLSVGAVGAPLRRQSEDAGDVRAWRERQRRADRRGGAVLHRAQGRRGRDDHGSLPARRPRRPRDEAPGRRDRSVDRVVREAFPVRQRAEPAGATMTMERTSRHQPAASPVASFIAVVALMLGGAATIRAQSGTAQIVGVAHDEQGGVLPGVTVVLRNQDSGVTRTAVSEADGRYRFPALAPGRYTLRSELSGFATVEINDLTITIGLDLKQ